MCSTAAEACCSDWVPPVFDGRSSAAPAPSPASSHGENCASGTRYLIISSARSGSTTLCWALGHHTDIVCNYEALNTHATSSLMARLLSSHQLITTGSTINPVRSEEAMHRNHLKEALDLYWRTYCKARVRLQGLSRSCFLGLIGSVPVTDTRGVGWRPPWVVVPRRMARSAFRSPKSRCDRRLAPHGCEFPGHEKVDPTPRMPARSASGCCSRTCHCRRTCRCTFNRHTVSKGVWTSYRGAAPSSMLQEQWLAWAQRLGGRRGRCYTSKQRMSSTNRRQHQRWGR